MARKPRKTKTEKQAELAAAQEQPTAEAVFEAPVDPAPVEDSWPEQPAIPDFPPDKGPVPEDGAEAYRLGFSAADCPFSSETEDEGEYDKFIQWNEAWDAAADEAEPEPTGSVVK